MRDISEFDELFKRSATEIWLNDCKKKYEFFGDSFSADQLCAENYIESDICAGSSGAFLGTSEGNFHVVHGIASLESSVCGSQAFPSVYTRIASYTNWIEGIVWPKAESIQGNVASKNQTGDATQFIQDTTKIPVTPYKDRIIFPD